MGLNLGRPEAQPLASEGARKSVGMPLAALVLAFALLTPFLATQAASAAGGVAGAVEYLEGRELANGGFAEPGRQPEPGLTAWAVLGLAAAGRPPEKAAAFLAGQPYPTATDLALRILALDALGKDVARLATQLRRLRRPSGSIGPLVNSTAWGVIALRAAGSAVEPATVRFLLRTQARSGGWGWRIGGSPDADDTAAAVQALRAAGVSAASRAVRRGLAFLRSLQRPDGGFESEKGKGSNAQSTAWAIQAFLAVGADPGRRAFAYLRRLQRPDGSFRYSARYATTPVWVTSYALAALARRHYPL